MNSVDLLTQDIFDEAAGDFIESLVRQGADFERALDHAFERFGADRDRMRDILLGGTQPGQGQLG